MKSLEDRIRDLDVDLPPAAARDLRSLMEETTRRLADPFATERAAQEGERAPRFELRSAYGETLSLEALLSGGPVVLNFYQGGWSPICNLELRALQEALPAITSLGGRLVAVAPDPPERARDTVERNGLTFDILVDPARRLARAYGLACPLDASIRPLLEAVGAPSPAEIGERCLEISLPATCVIDSGGTITRAFVSADCRHRLEPVEVIRALAEIRSRWNRPKTGREARPGL